MAKVPATKVKAVSSTKTKTPATKAKVAKMSAVKSKVVPTVKAKTKKLSAEKILARNEKIQSLYSTGKYSIRALALKVGMSKSRVGEIV